MARRADFLAANRGLRAPMPGFVLLVHDRHDGDPTPRLGITVTKKIGGAVIRNRMKRRFRALARAMLPTGAIAGADHVLIGRAGGVERDYALLVSELEKALRKLAAKSKAPTADGRGERRADSRESSRSNNRAAQPSPTSQTQTSQTQASDAGAIQSGLAESRDANQSSLDDAGTSGAHPTDSQATDAASVRIGNSDPAQPDERNVALLREADCSGGRATTRTGNRDTHQPKTDQGEDSAGLGRESPLGSPPPRP